MIRKAFSIASRALGRTSVSFKEVRFQIPVGDKLTLEVKMDIDVKAAAEGLLERGRQRLKGLLRH